MKVPLLRIKNLAVTVESKTVIKDVSLDVDAGQVLAIMGANGSGKSSLAMTLMGDSKYSVTKGNIEYSGADLVQLEPDVRSRAGIFVGWQNPVVVPGVSVFSMCKASYEAHGKELRELVGFKKDLENLAIQVGLSIDYIGRNVNEGFSGGEKKRLELLQLLLLQPKLAILDEIDSGLDVDGLKKVAQIVNDMKKKGTSFILITHYKKLLEYIEVDQISVMRNGKIVRSGGSELADLIEEKGYGKLSSRV